MTSASDALSQYHRYLDQTTLGSFVEDVSAGPQAVDVRQILLALGLLLQPVMSSPGQSIEKGLQLPLTADELTRPYVATFWMDLISRFLAPTQHDLTLFLPRGSNHGACLLIGFSAGSASVLQGLLDARVTAEQFISLGDSPWVEPYVANDYALKKLSSYLKMPQISLSQVLVTFEESFLGT